MFRCTTRLAHSANYISRDEFLTALKSACPSIFNRSARRPIGIAVSGGADSMALAAMCSTYMQGSSKQFRAFVVDHGIRDSSQKEAQEIYNVLTGQLAIPTEVLRIHIRDIKPSNLETRARAARFDALGSACLRRNISYVLFGHHGDDDYETFLQRISHRHHADFLMIHPERHMPQVTGRHGLNRSGNMRILPSLKRQGYWEGKSLDFASRVVGLEDGGVLVGRPLLDFSKDRLIATCRELGVSWIEDETNKDPTLTARNAIRHIVKNHRMPAALTKNSFLRIRNSIRERQRTCSLLAEKLFDMCDINFDARSGTAQVRFPKAAVLKSIISDWEPAKYADSIQVQQVVALLLRMVQRIVTASFNVSFTEMGPAVRNILTPLEGESGYDEHHPRKAYFRIGVCQFIGKRTAQDAKNDPQLDLWAWTVSKAGFPSFMTDESPSSSLTSTSSNINSTLCPLAPIHKPRSIDIRIPVQNDSHQPDFHLWDHRFWIRVRHEFDRDLWIKPLTDLRWNLIRGLIKGGYFKFAVPELNLHAGGIDDLNEIKKLAKGKIIFTLPVIEGPPLPNGQFPIPIAIPTLGLRLSPRGSLRELWNWPCDVSWEVRYRQVDLGTNWESRLAAEDERWSWNKPARSPETKEPISS